MIPPDEFKVTVVPANSAAPSAVIVILAASAAASFVDIANAPFSDTVNVALSPADPVIVITLPFTSISSTVNDVSIPTDVIFVWAAVKIVPVTLPVILPLKTPEILLAVKVPVEAL